MRVDPSRSILSNVLDGTLLLITPLIVMLAIWNTDLILVASILVLAVIFRGIWKWRTR